MPEINDQFVNLTPELDSDEHDNERTTPPGHIWRVTAVGADHVSIVCDETGAWINPSEGELADPKLFVKLQAKAAVNRASEPVPYIGLHDLARWRKVDAFIKTMTLNAEDLSVDFTSANFQPEGLHLTALADLFIPKEAYL